MDTVDKLQTSHQGFEPFEIVGTSSLEQLEVAEVEDTKSISPLRAAVRRFLRDRRAVFCLGVVLFIIIFSYVFPLLYQHMGPTVLGGASGQRLVGPDYYHQPGNIDPVSSNKSGTLFPLNAHSLYHPLGADTDGRDILARLMAGVNTSINIALLVEILDIGLGVTLGMFAGWYGGLLGNVLDRFTDIMFAFPGLLLIILIGATLGPNFDKFFHYSPFSRVSLLVLSIGFLAWPLMMRFVRGRSLELKEQQFIEAARTVGASDLRIIWRHIAPNVVNVVIVAATLDILATIVGEAGVSLLGVGIQSPATSLGLMISDAQGSLFYGSTIWYQMLWPSLLLIILVICFSFVGDGVSDAFNPRSKD